MTFIDRDQAEWKTVHFLEKPDETFEYHFDLPRPLADWDVFACWERERFHSMRDNLTRGDILFDIGTEQGWCNLIYADIVGPDNMVLIEPTQEFWPNIQTTWEHNYDQQPKACYSGLLSDVTNTQLDTFNPWPAAAVGPLIDRNKYQYIHEHDVDVPQMTLDDFVERSGIIPDAITMDVEGAEFLIIHGATNTLINHRPLVWISVHPDLIARDYGCTDQRLHAFMERLKYTPHLLAIDHEEHWLYLP